MKDVTPSVMRRLLAAEFDRRGWSYDPTTAGGIVDAAMSAGRIQPDRLAAEVPSLFLDRHGLTREVVARAISDAIGDGNPVPEHERVTLLVQDQRFSLHMAPGAQMTGSNVNIGSTQINVHNTVDKADVLAAVAALVRAGLSEDWNGAAAAALAKAIDERDDIELDEVQQVSSEVIRSEEPDRQRAKALLAKIAVSGVGGALATGISAGVGDLLHLLPT